jgi:hypothetical protein
VGLADNDDFMTPQKRVFSEQETSEVLQRAARLQESSSEGAYTPGVTRDELERIAVEAGIDPKFIEKALVDIDQNTPKKGWLNLSEEYERVVEGEVDPNDFDEILRDLKPAGRGGMRGANQVGRTVSMQTFYDGAMCYVEMTSRNGRTRVKVRSVPFMAYFMSLHPALLLGLAISISLGKTVGALAGLFTFFAFMLTGIAGFAGLTKKGHRSAKKLVDVLEKRAEEETGRLRENLAKSASVQIDAIPKNDVIQDMPG